MKKINWVLGTSFVMLFAHAVFAANESSPAGYWKTIDDVTGQTKSIVQIDLTANHELTGTVTKLFLDPDKKCTECTGAKKNQPVLGMNVLEGLKQSQDGKNQWVNGMILDPKNGKTYHCNMQLMENGQKLLVRGYIGIPLFGRSQTWIRATGPQSA